MRKRADLGRSVGDGVTTAILTAKFLRYVDRRQKLHGIVFFLYVFRHLHGKAIFAVHNIKKLTFDGLGTAGGAENICRIMTKTHAKV
jgi:hypothetical protein